MTSPNCPRAHPMALTSGHRRSLRPALVLALTLALASACLELPSWASADRAPEEGRRDFSSDGRPTSRELTHWQPASSEEDTRPTDGAGTAGASTGSCLARLLPPPQTKLARLIYDDNYLKNNLDDRYPYLRLANGTYLGIRDYFDFDQVFWPTREHLEGLNIEQALYEEARAFEITATQASMDTWHYSDERQLASSGGHLADPAACRASMAKLERELAQAAADPSRLFEPGVRNMQLLRWIDAWGRPASETYLGNSFWLGSYRGCRGASVELESNGSSRALTFNFCWAKVAPRGWPADDVMRPRMSIRVGVCLPDSCDTRQANALAPAVLKMMHFNFAPVHKERFTRILDIYCLPVRPPAASNGSLSSLPLVGDAVQLVSGLPLGARVFFAALLAWLALVACCSLHECRRGQQQQQQVAASWTTLLSVQENYRAFVRDDAPPASSRVDLRALGLPRLFASLLVLLGHSFIQNYYSLHSTHLQILEARKYGYHLFALTWKSVEIFLVLSGILTAYSVLNKFAPQKRMGALLKPRVWLALNLIRFLRTAPLMMIMWAFVRTTYLHLGEGPYWDYGTNKRTFMGACQRISWWRWLIYPIIADYQGRTGDPYQHECLSVSWYIVTDLKMFLVVPLYIYVIYMKPRWRWPTLFASLTISTLWRCAHLHLQQLVHLRQIFSYGEMHAIHIFITFLDSAYYSPVDRFQAVALGLMGGLYLYKYKTGRLKRWPWWMRGKLPVAAMLAWLAFDALRRMLDELHYRRTGIIPSDAYILTWLVLRPRADALIATLLTLRLCTDWAPSMMRHSLMVYKLSKLSYCVYVLHSLLIHYAVSSHERARPDSVAVQIFMLAAYVALLSFLIAFPLYLLVESPLTLLVARLTSLAGGTKQQADKSCEAPARLKRRSSVTNPEQATAASADKKVN